MEEDLQQLENFCLSDALTLDSLQKEIGRVFRALQNRTDAPFLHLICMNKRVTLEIVQYMLHNFPGAIKDDISTISPTRQKEQELDDALPLHIACYNEDCPDEVIKFLMETL